MKTRPKILAPKILPAVCCIAMLGACATNKPVTSAPSLNNGEASWSIKPMPVKSSNDKPESMYQMGRYYQGQNRYDLALAAYQKALAADDAFVEARNGLGVIYSRQGKYREAIEAFQTAIKQSPKAAHIYSNLGYAYYLQGQYAESIVALEQSTAINPTSQRALNNLALAYAKIGKKEESLQVFTQAVNIQEHHTNVAMTDATAKPVLPVVTDNSEQTSVAASKPIDKVLPAEVSVSGSTQQIVHDIDGQSLALPKDRGIVRPALASNAVAEVQSRMKVVQVDKNVYELHERPYAIEPMNVVAMSVITIDNKPLTTKARLEVANGNGITGMAGKLGKLLTIQGYQSVRLTNQKPFQVRMTQIQYREGYQAAAQLLKLTLSESPELVQRNDMRADVAVRLVLGKDMATRVASFDSKQQKINVALNTLLF